jgi:hypothetical protein
MYVKIFAPHVSSITAIDTSPTMIERYEMKMQGCGCPQHLSVLFHF